MQSQPPDDETMTAWSDSRPREEMTAIWASKRRRLATIYDAVAGKVSHDQALRDVDNDVPELGQGGNAAANTTNRPAAHPPEEVLFRRRNAPERYAEQDVYFANERDLPGAGQGVLPNSDLLTAVHGYTSKFYEAMGRRESRSGAIAGRSVDERSMDETALLAFGMLLEEAGREMLGRRGDLVFTEEADATEASGDEELTDYAAHAATSRARSTSASRTKRRRLADP